MVFTWKIDKIPEFYTIFARKMPDLYVIIAKKTLFPEFPPSPTPIVDPLSDL